MPEALYIVDGKPYTAKQLKDRLGITLSAVRARIYERRERGLALTWLNLKKARRGGGKLRNIIGDKHPGSQLLREHLNNRMMSVSEFDEKIGYGNVESVRRILIGRFTLTPDFCERAADVLMLTDNETRALHRAAAKQAGWKI